MKIVQKRLADKVEVDLQDDQFLYSVSDLNSTNSFRVRYFDFDPDPLEEVQQRSVPALYIGGFFFLLGVMQLLMKGLNDRLGVSGPIWMLLGLLFFFVYWVRRTTYILHETRDGSVAFLKDEKYDLILREISAARNTVLKAELDFVDPDADPAEEIAKFQWLREQGTLSDAELEERIREVRAFEKRGLAAHEPDPN